MSSIHSRIGGWSSNQYLTSNDTTMAPTELTKASTEAHHPSKKKLLRTPSKQETTALNTIQARSNCSDSIQARSNGSDYIQARGNGSNTILTRSNCSEVGSERFLSVKALTAPIGLSSKKRNILKIFSHKKSILKELQLSFLNVHPI